MKEKVFRVNLDKRKISEEDWYTLNNPLLGGRALTSKMVAKEIDPRCHALGDGNKLIIATGYMAGIPLTCCGRLSIGFKSPLTGGIKESNVGGTAGQKMSALGIRAIILEGKPTRDETYILKVSADGADLKKADELRGMKNYEAVEHLKMKFGESAGILSIGVAGEMGLGSSTIAVMDSGGKPGHHAGRGGAGAVMGSKGIKAIVFEIARPVKPSFSEDKKLLELAKQFNKKVAETKTALSKYGTAVLVNTINTSGGLPTRNFRYGQFEGVNQISGEALYDLIVERGGKPTHACMPGCVIACSNVYLDKNKGYLTTSLEYETIVMMGSNLGIGDLDTIAQLDKLCDDIGVDTIEIGGALGVLMESGYLAFGDSKGTIRTVEEIGQGTVLGRVVGNGVTTTGRVFGQTRVPAVKGQGMPAFDPRALKGMGVTFSTSPMGADHTAGSCLPGRPGFDPEYTVAPSEAQGQERISHELQIMLASIDAAGVCFFVGATLETLDVFSELLSYKYQRPVSRDDLIQVGVETLLTEYSFNQKAGLSKLDPLPDFFLKETLEPHQVGFDVTQQQLESVFEELLRLKKMGG
jgi:aldehyde:ferredoxin oxidoreductase